ncbi:MAG TPA: alkaline phosphatase D family protein [Pirellulaceae bacterium]|jgi:hypothetical protein|nr:alkaline phosphatase D family protein [Pirellulaceae bacterium]
MNDDSMRIDRRTALSLGAAAVAAGALRIDAASAQEPGEAASPQDPPRSSPLGFASDWSNAPDRVWLGESVWANPMEDWRLEEGRAVCTTAAPGRNVHCLTRQLGKHPQAFETSVVIERVAGERGEVGFEIGIHDEIDDYRGWCLFGKGLRATLATDGTLRLAAKKLEVPGEWRKRRLTLRGEAQGDGYRLTLLCGEAEGEPTHVIALDVDVSHLYGNVALIQNPAVPAPRPGGRGGPGSGGGPNWNARFAFSDWKLSGEKLTGSDEQAFGPILWCMHTVSDSRGADGSVLNLTALLPPLGEAYSEKVTLEADRGNGFEPVAESELDPDAWTATFRVANWPSDKAVPYRVVYQMAKNGGAPERCEYSGTIRPEPKDRPLKLGALTCQYHSAFPYEPLVERLAAHDPDMLYFSGDQIYEGNGGFGIVREPADRAVLNYLRKFYLFGWAFGDVMRDRPTLCIPDDHDVFQGNIWGEGGKPMAKDAGQSAGGYIEPVQMVNVVHRTNCSHHPDLFDPSPVAQGMSVYYGDMVYGRVSFAIVSDRQFKSGPERVNADSRKRADHITDPDFDLAELDAEGLELLGERQEKFLEAWVADWRGADMKVFLSETVFAGAATHHGTFDGFLRADLDSNGWPQTPRNEALRILRKALPLHVNGDQHLATMIHYGIDEPRDGFWSFCTPAISTIYQRWWRPDELGWETKNRPEHGLPNTGQYVDSFGHPTFVYAVGNPDGTGDAKNRYRHAQSRAGGFGIVTIDGKQRTYLCECYRFLGGHPEGEQYPGWPVTIRQSDNDGRTPTYWLPELVVQGISRPVVKVYSGDATGELLYAFRLKDSTFRPHVYAPGTYAVILGEPGKVERSLTGLEAKVEKDDARRIDIGFGR